MEKIWLSFFPIDNDNAVFYAEVPKVLFSEGMVLALGRDHTLMLYGGEGMEIRQRDIKRAEIVRDKLKE